MSNETKMYFVKYGELGNWKSSSYSTLQEAEEFFKTIKETYKEVE